MITATADDIRHIREKHPHLLRWYEKLEPVRKAQILYNRDKLMKGKKLGKVGALGSFLLVVSVAHFIETNRNRY